MLSSMSSSGQGPSPVRDRLLEAADRLFYTEGVRATGIDRVLAEAGAAKASLYTHFGSKDELVLAYLSLRTERARAEMLEFVEASPPADRAVRVFDFVAAWAERGDFRGCPMLRVASEIVEPEHPARQCAQTHRAWLLAHFATWAAEAGAADPAALSRALLVLFDGAAAAAMLDGPERARDARWAAAQLVDAARRSR